MNVPVVTAYDFGEPVSVNVEGVCNHADHTTFYVDRDGEAHDTPQHDSVWTNQELECNTCGAILREGEPAWEYVR